MLLTRESYFEIYFNKNLSQPNLLQNNPKYSFLIEHDYLRFIKNKTVSLAQKSTASAIQY